MLSLPLPLRQIAGRHASPFRSVDDTWHRNIFGRVNTAAFGLSCLFGNDELVEFERTVLIITSVSKNCCKTLLDQLLGNVAKAVISMLLKYAMNLVIDKLVLVAITDGYAFSFFKISFLGLDVVDVNIDIFSDQPLSQESCEKGSAKRLFFFPWVLSKPHTPWLHWPNRFAWHLRPYNLFSAYFTAFCIKELTWDL